MEAASRAHVLITRLTGRGLGDTGRNATTKKSEAASSGRAKSADSVCLSLQRRDRDGVVSANAPIVEVQQPLTTFAIVMRMQISQTAL